MGNGPTECTDPPHGQASRNGTLGLLILDRSKAGHDAIHTSQLGADPAHGRAAEADLRVDTHRRLGVGVRPPADGKVGIPLDLFHERLCWRQEDELAAEVGDELGQGDLVDPALLLQESGFDELGPADGCPRHRVLRGHPNTAASALLRVMRATRTVGPFLRGPKTT
jgi:hypothetical protein